MSGSGNENGFLSRWARRKAAVAAEEATDAATIAAHDAKDVAAKKAGVNRDKTAGDAAGETSDEIYGEHQAETDEAALERLGLAAPETMQAGDDFAAFLRHPMPAALRRRALRRLWSVNPVLGDLDGLVDYGEDFTGKGDIGAVIVTAWQTGRGYLSPPPDTPPDIAADGLTDVPQDVPADTPVQTDATAQAGDPVKTAAETANADASLARDVVALQTAPQTLVDTFSEGPTASAEVPTASAEVLDDASVMPAQRMRFRFDQG